MQHTPNQKSRGNSMMSKQCRYLTAVRLDDVNHSAVDLDRKVTTVFAELLLLPLPPPLLLLLGL
jgi:hypothetical protein